MRDVDDRDTEVITHALEQVGGAHPQRCIHHGHRLIRHEERRIWDERPRDRRAALARRSFRGDSGP